MKREEMEGQSSWHCTCRACRATNLTYFDSFGGLEHLNICVRGTPLRPEEERKKEKRKKSPPLPFHTHTKQREKERETEKDRQTETES